MAFLQWLESEDACRDALNWVRQQSDQAALFRLPAEAQRLQVAGCRLVRWED